MSHHFYLNISNRYLVTNMPPPAALRRYTRDDSSVFVAKRVPVFHHPQSATHHGAATLRVVVQQAQSAQSLLIPQPVLGRVQHTVTAQHLQHTDKPLLREKQQHWHHTETHMEHMTPHTHTHTVSESFTFICVSPSACWDQLTFLQDLYSRISVRGTGSTICQLTRHCTVYIYDSYCFLPGGPF